MLRVAVVQADVLPGRTSWNLERAGRFVATAAGRGASLVVLPEMYLTGYEVWRKLAALSLPPGSPVLAALARVACRHRCAVLVGYPERRGDDIYNAVAAIAADGTVATAYRKIHLFGREREYFRPGDQYLAWRLGEWVVGVLICYDLEFPESARVLALTGADLIAVATANMAPYREAQEVYVRARARENQVFVALANRVGREGRTRFVGGSGVWDPAGGTLVHADGEEALLVASVSRAAARRARRPFSYLHDRRPECYATLAARPSSAAALGGSRRRGRAGKADAGRQRQDVGRRVR